MVKNKSGERSETELVMCGVHQLVVQLFDMVDSYEVGAHHKLVEME